MKTLKIEQRGLTQTIQLHEDYTVTIDYTVIMIEPKKYVPKAGDCVKVISASGKTSFVICEKFDDKGLIPIFGNFIGKDNTVLFQKSAINFPYTPNHTFEKITPEQFQSEFEKLGYIYDFETNTASKLDWVPTQDDYFYWIETTICEGYYNHVFHKNLIGFKNYFKYKKLAEIAFEKRNELFELLKHY